MKVLIFDWAWACKEELAELGYKHNDVLDISQKSTLYSIVDALLELQIMVMIDKGKNDYDYTLYVDCKRYRFRQR